MPRKRGYLPNQFINTSYIIKISQKANIINLPGIGKVKGLTQPTWKDSKSNLLWALWLIISSLSYFKTAIISYTLKWQSKSWFKYILKSFITLWSPISKIFKVLRIFRIIRFTFIIGGLLFL